MSCYRLIDAEKANYSVSLLCKVLKVSRSGYYDWKDRPPSRRERENTNLTERIREVHHRSRGTYGYPRVHAELRALGIHCNRKRVARLMRKDGLRGCMRGRRRKHTTRQNPLAIPAPYNHSNINSDEVIYYVAGNFMSRRGVDVASFTVHPAGIPHGPHPGTVEASIGKEATEELAVMIDTFHPLSLTRHAVELEDNRYPYSWIPPEDGADHARQLAERGPEAFPD